METLDAANRHSIGLPSINHLDSDKIKREEVEYQRKQSAAMVSPLHPYAGQPHSHSNHQSSSANTLPGPLGGLLSPPESRRTSGDEKEQRGPTRQSLPSIHEALGAEQPLSYPGPPPSVPVSTSQQYHPRSTTVSPSDTRSRNFSTDLHASQGPSNPFSHPHPRSPFMGAPASTAPPPPPPPPSQTQTDSLPRPSFSEQRPYASPRASFSDSRSSFSDSRPRPSFSDQRPAFPEPRNSYSGSQHNSKLHTLHPLRTIQSPPPGPSRPNLPYSSYPSQSSSTYESSAPHSAGPMNPNYGYSQYPPNYPLSAPAPSGPSSGYPPSSSTYSAPPRYPPPSWGSDNSELARLEEKKIGRSSLVPYGESVKRHLESFDLEASLNEMAEGSGRITDFSKVYRQRAHENQRIGMTPQSMPRLEEVDDMMKHSERIQVSLQRMREVVLNHQQVNIVEPPQDPRYRPMNGYDHDGPNVFAEDPKGGGGFAGADSKKRRGVSFPISELNPSNRKTQRAAPPGRCHSCNRAETPEWRRGPDGARTLCNACGLHYAKLTRKMGGKQAMTSSNLRPKSLDQGSPGD